MSLTIRPARPDEAGALTALCLRAKASNGYDDAFMAACVEEMTVTEADIQRDSWWTADDDGDLSGCVCLSIEDGTAMIHALYVDPTKQRRGIGGALWQQVSTEAAARKLSRLELDADPNAVEFYERMGFTVIGQVPSGSIPGRTLPRMAWTEPEARTADAE